MSEGKTIEQRVDPSQDQPPARKHPLASCESCPYQRDTAYVPSQAASSPIKLAVVGEAPGPQEARLGIPFQGPSGELLDHVLEHHGITRSEVFVTNVVSCRPSGPTEAPPKEAVKCCSERFLTEMEESGAQTILAVGNTAAKACIDDNRTITHVRVGPPKPYKHDHSKKVIASWHPAYCLRSPDAFPSFVDDVGKINKPQLENWEPPQYVVIDDPENAVIALQRLQQNTTQAVIDIEVGVEKDFDYVHPEDYELLCVGIAYAPKRAIVLGENSLKDLRSIEALKKYLSSVKLIGHNLRFDLRGLSPIVGVQKQYFDTMLASYAVDERPRQHGLKTLAVERLGAPKYDDEIKQYIPRGGSYANIPRPLLYKYNAYDVACTWELYELFVKELGPQRKIHDFMIRASNQLIHLELAGITIDLDYNELLQQEFTEQLSNLEDKINNVVGYTINPRSPQQVTKYLTGQGLIVKTTNREFLEAIEPKLAGTVTGEFVSLLLEHRKVSKLFGTYVKKLPQKLYRGKIHTNYLLHGTTSGRLASRNENLQNIARDKRIKNQYTVEDEDHILIQADYKQNEGRTICALARDEYQRDIFNDPSRDIFDEMCNDIFGKDNWTKEEDRVKIKSVYYGNAYGRGIQSIATELDIDDDEAHDLVREFRRLSPNVVMWQNDVKRRILDGEDLVTPYGRRRSFHLITNDNKHDVLNEGLSYLPQSIASDICLSALIVLRPLLDGLAVVRLTVHDSIVVECHKEKADLVERLMKNEMLASAEKFTDYCVWAVDFSRGQRYGQL